MPIKLNVVSGVTYRLHVRDADVMCQPARRPELRLIADVEGQTRAVYLPLTCFDMLKAGGAVVERRRDGLDYVRLLGREWELRLIGLTGYPSRYELVLVTSQPGVPVPRWSASPSSWALAGTSRGSAS